jgi:hypothetical protein
MASKVILKQMSANADVAKVFDFFRGRQDSMEAGKGAASVRKVMTGGVGLLITSQQEKRNCVKTLIANWPLEA